MRRRRTRSCPLGRGPRGSREKTPSNQAPMPRSRAPAARAEERTAPRLALRTADDEMVTRCEHKAVAEVALTFGRLGWSSLEMAKGNEACPEAQQGTLCEQLRPFQSAASVGQVGTHTIADDGVWHRDSVRSHFASPGLRTSCCDGASGVRQILFTSSAGSDKPGRPIQHCPLLK